jgi:hypothetical protein
VTLANFMTAILLAAPPAPPITPPSDDDEAGDSLEPGEQDAVPPGEGEGNDIELDERRDPVLPYADEATQSEEVRWADEVPDEPELRWAKESPEDPELEHAEGGERSPPSGAALDRQDGRAQRDPEIRGYEASPQRFEFEIKFGPYSPDVDRNHEGDGPGAYESIFGETNSRGEAIDEPKPGLMTALAFEWQFVNFGGPFLLGTQIGYFRDKAQALVAAPEDGASTVRSAADTARFHVMPVSLSIGYRFEYLADRFRVPIVPYGKFGVAYGFWWSTDGNKEVSVNAAGEKGRGGTWGWQVNAGGMLRLDVFDVNNALDLDRNTGINHAYVFGEFQLIRLDDFGKERGVNVGDATWLLGLAIEF